MTPVVPSVKSFLIADSVFQQQSGKWCIIGAFNRIFALRFPVQHPSLGLFLRMADMTGEYDVQALFKDDQGRTLAQSPVFRLKPPNDRLAEVDFGVEVHNLLIPSEGTYFIQVLFNNEPAGNDIRLEVQRVSNVRPG